MNSCIKQVNDYDLVKKCCKGELICLKDNFIKTSNSKDGVQSQCKYCVSDYNKKNCDRNHHLLPNYRKKIVLRIVENETIISKTKRKLM